MKYDHLLLKTTQMHRNKLELDASQHAPRQWGEKDDFIFFFVSVSVSWILFDEKKYCEKWNYLPDSIPSSLIWKTQKRGFILR